MPYVCTLLLLAHALQKRFQKSSQSIYQRLNSFAMYLYVSIAWINRFKPIDRFHPFFPISLPSVQKKKSSQKNTLIQPLITPLNSIDENNLIPHSLLLEIIKFVSEMKKESLIADNRLQNQIKSFDRADLTREVGLWHRKRDGFRRRNDPPRGSIDRSIDRLTQFRATLTGDACDWPIQYTHTHAHV